ncbi:MAG: stage II sporulation protein M [Bacillota bacterium]|nr:stage II sporulation protein M [Bacillota bacterium]
MSKDKATGLSPVMITILLSVVIIGITTGSLVASKADLNFLSGLSQQLKSLGSFAQSDKTQVFKNSFYINFIWTGVIFLGGIYIFFAPIIPCVLAFKGFSFGFSAGYFIRVYGLKGLWFSACGITPHSYIYLLIFIIYGSEAATKSIEGYLNRQNYFIRKKLAKRYVIASLIAFGTLFTGAIIEALMSISVKLLGA